VHVVFSPRPRPRRCCGPPCPPLRALHGRIVQVSSLTGQFAWAPSGLYSASKAAVELLSEALAAEVARPAVRVTIVEPSTFATDFASTAHVVAPDEVYAPTVGEFLTGLSALPPSVFGDSADAIVAIAGMAEPPLRLAVGADAIDGIRAALESRPAELEKVSPALPPCAAALSVRAGWRTAGPPALHLPGRGRCPWLRQARGDAVLPADPLEQHTSPGRGLVNRPVNCLPLSVNTSAGTP
jgi:hypothetical protein